MKKLYPQKKALAGFKRLQKNLLQPDTLQTKPTTPDKKPWTLRIFEPCAVQSPCPLEVLLKAQF